MGTAFGSWESWDDGSIQAAVKDVGRKFGCGRMAGRRRADILVGSERERGEGGVGYIGIWHCSNREGRGISPRKLGIGFAKYIAVPDKLLKVLKKASTSYIK